MSTKKTNIQSITTVMNWLVGEPLSMQVLGSKQLKKPDVEARLKPLIKDLPIKMPVVIKIRSMKGLISELSIMPGPTIALCKFLAEASQTSFNPVPLEILKKAAELKIKYNLNTINVGKAIKSMLGTFKAANILTENCDDYIKSCGGFNE